MACTECRQQKVRCDRASNEPGPCSRCRRFRLRCIYSKTYKRQKRPSKVELQRELDTLRGNLPASSGLNSSADPAADIPNFSTLTPSTTIQWDDGSSPNQGQVATAVLGSGAQQADNNNVLGDPQSNQQSNGLGTWLEDSSATSDTHARDLHGLHVSAHEIDDCFSLFADNCLSFVPLVTSLMRPNDCYDQSQLLFWTIVAIGSRKYMENPTLIVELGPKVSKMAKMAIFRQEPVLLTIQAFVMLCSWPMPFESLSNDITPVLAGAALQLATSVGLHVYGVGQDFSRTKVSAEPDDAAARGRLWACCLIVSQRVITTNGTPPIILPDTYDVDALQVLTPTLRFQKRLSELLTGTVLDIQKRALFNDQHQMQELLDPILTEAVMQLRQLETVSTATIDRFYSMAAELHLLSFHLFKLQSAIEDDILIKMYDISFSIIELAMDLDESHRLADHGPIFAVRFLHSAAIAILRISKCHLAQHLDLDRGRRAYFALIFFHKKYSVRLDDAFARFTIILTQLWTSTKIFRHSDGTVDSLRVRSRARLGMSMVYDCFWWWREEYAAQPYSVDNCAKKTNNVTQNPELERDPLEVLDLTPGQLIPDLQWPTFDNLFADNWPNMSMDMSSL